MTWDRLVLLPLALGLLAALVVAINVLHGLGQSERRLLVVKLALPLGFGLLGLLLAWFAWQGPIATWPRPLRWLGWLSIGFGAVGVPWATARVQLRRRPAGIEERTEEVTIGPFDERPSGPYAWMLRLPGNESLRLRRSESILRLPGLSPTCDGLSILHLSDLHLAPIYPLSYFEAAIDEAARWAADLVCFTGDLVDDDAAASWVVPLLGRLRGRLGTFSILGNHDREHDPGHLGQALVAAGFTHLEGRWASVLTPSGGRVAVGGTSYPWGPRLSLLDRPATDLSILLSHSPDQFAWAARARFDLMLSGHNHGGQVRLPVVGPVFMPSVYSRRFDRGFFRRGPLTLHVSQGLAAKHPLRYGCIPEISRLVLQRPPDGAVPAPVGPPARPSGH